MDVDIQTAPLDDEAEAPEASRTPPDATPEPLAEPDDSTIAPPAPEPELPTRTLMDPLEPPVADPVVIDSPPVAPAALPEVARRMPPDVPFELAAATQTRHTVPQMLSTLYVYNRHTVVAKYITVQQQESKSVHNQS